MHQRHRTALVVGATGLIGRELINRLLSTPAYESVTALVRRSLPQTHPRLIQLLTDFDRLDQLDLGPAGVTDLYCALGTTIKKAGSQAAFRQVDYEYPLTLAHQARHRWQTERFMLVTSMGADPRSRIFYSRVKGEVEAAITAVGLPALHIFRPSLLLGDRGAGELRPGEAVAAAISRLLRPLFAGPLARYRPIEGRAVAAAMVAAAERPAQGAVAIYDSDQIAALAATLAG